METTVKSIKFRIDPKALSTSQEKKLFQYAGASRAFWNWGLDLWNQQEKAVRAEFNLRTSSMSEEEKSVAIKDKKLWKDIRDSIKILDIDGTLTKVDAFSLDKAHTRHTLDPSHPLHWYKAEDHGIPAMVVKDSIRNLGTSVSRYMSGKVNKGKSTRPRKDGMPDGWPRFKSKYDNPAFVRPALNYVKRSVYDGPHRIFIQSIGSIRVGGSTSRLKGYLDNGGVAKTARFTYSGGYWYVSLSVTVPVPYPSSDSINRLRNNGPVGIDFGVKTLATLSNGEIVRNPRTGKNNKASVDSLRKELSRKEKGSNNRLKTRKKLSRKLHRIDLSKKTMLHTMTKDWSTRFEVIKIEDLNISGMTSKVKPKKDPNNPGLYLPNGASAKSGLNREILDIGFYEIRRQLEYKSLMYGSNVIIIDRFFPSSKMCSSCGSLNANLSLSDRTYICDCGLSLDRDLNAAINILNYKG